MHAQACGRFIQLKEECNHQHTFYGAKNKLLFLDVGSGAAYIKVRLTHKQSVMYASDGECAKYDPSHIQRDDPNGPLSPLSDVDNVGF